MKFKYLFLSLSILLVSDRAYGVGAVHPGEPVSIADWLLDPCPDPQDESNCGLLNMINYYIFTDIGATSIGEFVGTSSDTEGFRAVVAENPGTHEKAPLETYGILVKVFKDDVLFMNYFTKGLGDTSTGLIDFAIHLVEDSSQDKEQFARIEWDNTNPEAGELIVKFASYNATEKTWNDLHFGFRIDVVVNATAGTFTAVAAYNGGSSENESVQFASKSNATHSVSIAHGGDYSAASFSPLAVEYECGTRVQFDPEEQSSLTGEQVVGGASLAAVTGDSNCSFAADGIPSLDLTPNQSTLDLYNSGDYTLVE